MIHIPDIIDDPRAMQLLCQAKHIIAATPAGDDAAQIHVHAYRMAERLRDLGKTRARDLEARCMENTQDYVDALGDIHRAEQLAAHHLDILDRIGGVPSL